MNDIPRVLTASQRKFYARWFLAAAFYNLAWGLAVIFFPRVPFRLAGIELPQPDHLAIQFWQCIGMFVLVFAIGYAALWRDPERYAPFALIALLGKVFGPIGFAWGWAQGIMPGQVGWTILTNDLLWWPAFGAFVWQTMLAPRLRTQRATPMPVTQA